MSGKSQFFEVLDEQGHKTGKVLDRETVHGQELWHEAVNVWMVNSKGEVLLQLRGPKVDLNPDVWDVAIGTHVRPQEDPTDSAIRCLKDEMGVVIAPDTLKHLFNIQSANPIGAGRTHKTVNHVFLLKRDLPLTDFTYDSEKIAQLVWKPLIEVMAEVGSTETSKRYYPRAGNFYPRLFDALQAEMSPGGSSLE
jgi:isopentenyl-diphosphate delta-isomerase